VNLEEIRRVLIHRSYKPGQVSHSALCSKLERLKELKELNWLRNLRIELEESQLYFNPAKLSVMSGIYLLNLNNLIGGPPGRISMLHLDWEHMTPLRCPRVRQACGISAVGEGKIYAPFCDCLDKARSREGQN
jgi:hypothetical protein